MKKIWIILIVIGSLIALAGITVGLYFYFSLTTHNQCVTLNENVNTQWSQVENVYQRRADLIPNLVNTVKGYASHEKETLEGVIEARAKATSVNINAANMNAASMQAFQQAQGGLSSALSKLMVVVEKYPELKANQNFLELQAQLEGTENRIAVERKKFNEKTRLFNTYIQKYPQVWFVDKEAYKIKPYFEAIKGAEKAPEVQF